MRQSDTMKKPIWTFIAGNKAYTSHSRHQLKNKRKALRSNYTFKGNISDIIPIQIDSSHGEARIPIIYVATMKKGKRDARS